MYSVFVNGRPLLLEDTRRTSGAMISLRYDGRPQTLIPIVNTLENGGYPEGVQVYGASLEALWEDFQSLFVELRAAGGAVLNADQLLCIYRRGYWDLPKGKIDPGETIEEAAIREVQEETGINSLSIVQALPTTYHVYREKGRRILKPTFWFAMRTEDKILQAQAEEGIEEARWVTLSELPNYKSQMYRNLHPVIDATLGLL